MGKVVKMEQNEIASTDPVEMDLTIDEITETNLVEIDLTIDEIQPLQSQVEMDTSIDEIQPIQSQTEMNLTIDEIQPSQAEMDLTIDETTKTDEIQLNPFEIEISELISNIKEETISSIIEKCEVLFEKDKSCENYNNILKVFNKVIKNRGFFDKDKVYSFQCFNINKFSIIKENEKKAHIILLMKDTQHRQATCMTILESIEIKIVPELESELLRIKKFMEDNSEYI